MIQNALELLLGVRVSAACLPRQWTVELGVTGILFMKILYFISYKRQALSEHNNLVNILFHL